MIATMWGFGRTLRAVSRSPIIVAWGSVVGSALQVRSAVAGGAASAPRPPPFAQLPGAKMSAPSCAISLPVFVSRGVVQISAYVDAFLASCLPTGAVAALSNAQTLYLLPVSLFGMSVSAAELPQMSGAIGRRNRSRSTLCASASMPACARSPFSWCPRSRRFWFSAT